MRSTKIIKICSSSPCTCLHHMVILRTRNKITDFFMMLAWASPFNIETASGICFMFLVFVHELNWISIHFNIPASTRWTRGESMLDAGQERARWWLSILVLHLHSGSVGPAFRVDFGQFTVQHQLHVHVHVF